MSTLRGRTVAESADGAPAQLSAEPSYAPEPAAIGVRWKTTDGASLAVLVNRTQLHGEACMLCARMNGSLVDAGHAYTDEGGWRARVCEGGCTEAAA